MSALSRHFLSEDLDNFPIIDVHTHLVGGRLGARGLHDILLYHMAVSELHSAGCPSGARLTQYPGWPDISEAHDRIQEALPYLPMVRGSSISWSIRTILEDLYDWTEPVTADNWRALDDLIRKRSDDRQWHREVMKRANIARFGTEIARREEGQDDDILQYALEWAFFTRCQWGEFDTAVYELEKCWGKQPGPPSPIGGQRPLPERTIRTLDDVHEAMDWYISAIPYGSVLATATHISTDIDFRDVTPGQMKEALARRGTAGPEERDIYASYINEIFLTELEKRADAIVYQFSFAAEPLPYETASRISQTTIAQVAAMISRHPGLRFQTFLASRHANQSMCTLARELTNLSLVGYWWHNFFPGVIRSIIDERLDMLPVNRQVGFFSDAYCVEWAYAKAKLVRLLLGEALECRVDSGQYTPEMALDVARAILYETPQSLLGFVPQKQPDMALSGQGGRS